MIFSRLKLKNGSSEIVAFVGDSRGDKLSAVTWSVHATEIYDGHT